MLLIGKRIHFMGIGGIGVSALAEMALAEGAAVSGCDRTENDLTRKLAAKGIEVKIGHHPDHAIGIDLLVHTSAVPPDHPERAAAGNRQEKRGLFLARFLDARPSAGVAGTHGKTTTTWLIAHLLIQGNLDPSVFVGGVVSDLPDGNHREGIGPFVAELDESDESFLLPKLKVAVVTNIESDHLSHYGTEDALFAAFDRFAANAEKNGILVAGIDNPGSARLLSRNRRGKRSFGLSPEADIRGEIGFAAKGETRFRAFRFNRDLGEFILPLPGRHNVQNALAAIAVAMELGLDADVARRALASVKGVERRLERLGTIGDTALYSDYAHHPTEAAASLAALRENHAGRLLTVFQPHLYTRTRDYADAFGQALARSDALILADVYPAREEPIPGVSSELILDSARRINPDASGPFPLEKAATEAAARAGDFAAVVFMGAGDIDDAARRLARRGEKR
ncbi:MAG: UDP-N-acetylmuramate--L-alanine ligase [Planctomycetota bacterium]|jgi:UDP-N-acetylmuramate--alanine ligase|nr:UDP-N-acetylmuramate--L-alanine ligase [Planctomycetota bacterium]